MDADRIVESTPLTAELLRAVGADPLRWLDPLAKACARYAIDDGKRVAMFVAQCAHESSGFTRLRESLKYSASRLLVVFAKYFDPDEAVEFAYDEVRIAERVYGGRMGNGPEGVGDGFNYRGRGLIQLTGKDNYRRCGEAIGIDLVSGPGALEIEAWAALSAAWFWSVNGCNAFADADDIRGCTRRINGGINGLDERTALWDKALECVA